MKRKKLISVFACAFLLLGGGTLLAVQSVSKNVRNVKADDLTDLGTFTFDEANADSTPTGMYGVNWTTNDAPAGWNTEAFAPVDADSGVFVNGTRVGTEIKKTGPNTYYIAVPGGQIGTVAAVVGNWANSTYKFAVNLFVRQCVAETGKWELADLELEDYDVVSLQDANMPDFVDETAINTDELGGTYTYTTDAAALPMRNGYFGLTNETGSYAFQFNYKKTDTGTGWFNVLIGGSGTLYSSGHFLNFGFLDAWADTGHGQIKEMQGTGNNWSATELNDSDAFALNWNVGETNLLEMGAIKVKGFNLHYIFFKVNNEVKYRDYWELAAGGMTTRVCMVYSGTDAQVTNSKEVNGVEQLHTDGAMTGLATANDVCPAVSNWDDYFKSVDGNGLKLNGVPFGNSQWNYFKKTGANSFYLDLAGAGVDTNSIGNGDVITISGVFKAARSVGGVSTLYKAVFAESRFEYYGDEWLDVDLAALQQSKETAIADLDAIDLDAYYPDERAEVEALIAEAKAGINASLGSYALQDVINEADFQIRAIETKNQKDAAAIVAAINLIPDLGPNDYENYRQTVSNIRAQYNALPADAQALVDNILLLEGAEERIQELDDAKAAAEAVEAQIRAIGEVTLDKQDAIAAARTAYNALQGYGPAFLSDEAVEILLAAEQRIETLLAEKANAEAVEALINEIGTVDATQACQNKIAAADAAYSRLNSEEKTMVSNHETLEAAKTAFDNALAAAKQAAHARVEEFMNSVDLKKYSSDNQERIETLVAQAESAIDDATYSDGLDGIVDQLIVDINAIPQKKAAAKKGCGGSIAAASVVLSTLALAGLGLLSIKKRKED